MSIVSVIRTAAESVGITAIVSNSDAKIETQLNRLTDPAELPIMLVSWDMTSSASFDANGFLKNPETPIVALLMSKADSTEKDMFEEKAEEMKDLFWSFMKALYGSLVSINRDTSTMAITGAQAQLVPKYGMGKHSGVVCRWTMKSSLANC